MIKAELYFRTEASLGEGPLWDSGTLYWTDIAGKTLHSKADGAGSVRDYPVGVEVGAFALWDDRRMILAAENGFACLDLDSLEIQAWVDPEASIADNRFNDGKCDPCGRFLAGTMSRGGAAGQGTLYVLDQDRAARKLYAPVTCSNGLAWSQSGTTLYYIDTGAGVVVAFDYDLEHGAVSNRRVVIEIPDGSGWPDGMTIDCDGNLWIAFWGGWGVECWSPMSGRRLARVEVPASLVTSCVFGGPAHDTLFITTARIDLNPQELAKQDAAGSIFCARPGVCGHGAVRYRKGQP